MAQEANGPGTASEAPGSGWSLAMIVKDAADTLRGILEEAAGFCDELVVVDTGSSDSTAEIARERGATVHDFEWVDDFAAARNFAFDQCHGEWIVWLDHDDRVPTPAQKAFAELKQKVMGSADVDAVMVPYRTGFADADPSICTFSFDRERVIRRAAGLRWGGVVHEVIGVAPGRSLRWPAAWVEHRSTPGDAKDADRNLKILERAVIGGDRSARTLFYYANELRDHRRWEKALTIYREYLSHDAVDWEKYAALLYMSECAAALGDDDLHMAHLLEAMILDSRRAEAFNRIGMSFYGKREWERAIPFFTAASTLVRPAEGFVNDSDYTWVPWDYLSICCSELGRYQKALEHTMRALPTSTDRKRLMDNINFYLDRLALEARGGEPT
jgi:glycosyltransferase involved in cell wall biosynthesis